MNPRLSTKILRPDFQGEFTASILAAAASPDLISFAGGLPNPVSFPVEAMDKATHKVLEKNGVMALQYSGTQGYLPLREWVAKRYETMGVYGVTADDIIITNGSQQVLTMIGACMLDPGDKIIVENPTYLVALQSFHFFDPEVLPVTINPDGIDCDELAATVQANPDVKFAYVIPNFQNPTGLSYSKEVHDRIGWVCVRNKALREKLLSYKATADLHTNIFSQLVLAQYLADNDIDAHIEKTKVLYKHKAELMMDCMRKYLPEGVEFTPTEGGMFLWAKLPNGMSAVDLYRVALARGVAICPGDPFYEKERNVSTFRINYSNSSDEVIEKGIRILGEACAELIAKKGN